MLLFLIKRLLTIVPTALGVVTLTFLLIHLVPGDPVEVLLGEFALPVDRAAMEESLGLNLPIYQQFYIFFTNLLQGDLGNSFYGGKPVTELIWSRVPSTATLAAVSMLFALTIAIPLGVYSAEYRGKKVDKAATVYSLAGFSMPSFWLGPLLIIIFSLWLGWFPVSGKGGVDSIILPAITLGLGMSAFTTKLVRNAVLETLNSDYMRTAKAKGVNKQTRLFRHALRNALLPVITVVFLQAGALLTGAILTEAVFSWPGLGSLIIEGLEKRDYPIVQGCVLFIAFTYMFMTMLSDIVYAFADPRIRYGKEGS